MARHLQLVPSAAVRASAPTQTRGLQVSDVVGMLEQLAASVRPAAPRAAVGGEARPPVAAGRLRVVH